MKIARVTEPVYARFNVIERAVILPVIQKLITFC